MIEGSGANDTVGKWEAEDYSAVPAKKDAWFLLNADGDSASIATEKEYAQTPEVKLNQFLDVLEQV